MTAITGFAAMAWRHPPPLSGMKRGDLTVTTGEATDFWRETHYGFVHDNGHFLHHAMAGDFCAEVTVSARYEALYDQAGLMLMLDEKTWIKAGIEFAEGKPLFSTVLTRDYPDWAVTPLAFSADVLRLRLTRRADTVQVLVQDPGGAWQTGRLGYLPPDRPAMVGVMACSPTRAGFQVTFSDYQCGPLPESDTK